MKTENHKIVFALCTIFLVYFVVILEHNDEEDYNSEFQKYENVLESIIFLSVRVLYSNFFSSNAARKEETQVDCINDAVPRW